jgi:hypothetical protein
MRKRPFTPRDIDNLTLWFRADDVVRCRQLIIGLSTLGGDVGIGLRFFGPTDVSIYEIGFSWEVIDLLMDVQVTVEFILLIFGLGIIVGVFIGAFALRQ